MKTKRRRTFTMVWIVLALAFPVSVHAQGPSDFVSSLKRLHWDVVSACNANCRAVNLAAAPELADLASQTDLNVDDLTEAWISFNFEMGEQFRLCHNSAPAPEWWQGTHRLRLAIFALHLGVKP